MPSCVESNGVLFVGSNFSVTLISCPVFSEDKRCGEPIPSSIDDAPFQNWEVPKQPQKQKAYHSVAVLDVFYMRCVKKLK